MEQFGTFGEFLHVALIGDVVDSRSIDNRPEFQSALRSTLVELNRRHADALSAPLTLLRGDEIQGLFHQPETVVDVVVTLAESLYPHRLIYGLGYGELSTGLLAETAQMDGSCFQNAREAWHAARKVRTWMSTRGFGDDTDQAISAIFRLMAAIRRRWTSRQNEIAQVARTRRQKLVAEHLGVSPSVVSESLKAAGFEDLRAGESAAARLLENFGIRGEVQENSASEANHPKADPTDAPEP